MLTERIRKSNLLCFTESAIDGILLEKWEQYCTHELILKRSPGIKMKVYMIYAIPLSLKLI